MNKKIIDFNLKKKVIKLKSHPEFKVFNLDFEKLLDDIKFFKSHSLIIEKSDIIFKKVFKINKNYSKSVMIQQNFVEDFKEIV